MAPIFRTLVRILLGGPVPGKVARVPEPALPDLTFGSPVRPLFGAHGPFRTGRRVEQRRGSDCRLAGRRRAGGGRAGPTPRAGAGAFSRRDGRGRGRRGRPGAGDVHPRVSRAGPVPGAVPVPDLAPHHRRERAEGRGAPRGARKGGAARRRARGGRGNGREAGAGAGAAPALAARGVPAAGPAGVRVRGDRAGAGHDAGRRAGALPPRREAAEGVFDVNDRAADPRERELERRAADLGRGAGERLDVERVVSGVLASLRLEPVVAEPFWARPAWLRAAAGLVLLIGAGALLGGPVGRRTTPLQETAWVQAGDVQDLNADQLQTVIATLDAPLDRSTAAGDAGVEDLSETQLRALLRSMED